MLLLLNHAAQFLVRTMFDFYIYIILLRVVFHWTKVDSRNPILQMIARLTHLPLRPVYQMVPSFNGLDIGAPLLLLALTALKLCLISCLVTHMVPSFSGLIIISFADLLNQLINIFFYAILGLTFLSWINLMTFSPLIEILIKISEPLLRPVRFLLLSYSNIELSPLIVTVGLQLLKIILVTPLFQTGQRLLFYGA